MLCSPVFILPSLLTQIDTSAPMLDAFRREVKCLVESKPDTVVVFQTDMGVFTDAVNFVVPEDGVYLVGECKITADLALGRQMQLSLEEHQRSSHLIERSELLSAMQFFINMIGECTEKIPRILVVGSSLQSSDEHFKVGSLMRRAIEADSERVVMVAMGHLSSQLDKSSEFGYSRFGKEFNIEYMKYLDGDRIENFLLIDPFLLDEVAETLYKPTALVLGVLEGQVASVNVEEFVVGGVGYVVGEINSERR